MTPGHAARIHAGTWFQTMPKQLQDELLRLGQLRRISAGQRLFDRGDPPDGLYCVLEGAIRITSMSDAGKEALLVIIEPPHWFGEIALFDGLPRTHDAVAEGQTELLHVEQHALLAVLERNPAWWRELALLLTQKLRSAFLVLEETALLPAAARLARRLVTMAEGYGQWQDRSRRMIPVPQEQLARMLSLSRQTVNQILKQFEAQGAVRLPRGAIEILDIDKLRTLAF